MFFRFITYLPQIKVLLHFGNVVEMEQDFIITSVFTPFTMSVTVVVAGTLFLIIYDMIRWWRERRRKPIDPPAARPVPYKKYVYTLREHKEVCVKYQATFTVLLATYIWFR